MRGLSDDFMNELLHGNLNSLLCATKEDKDLILEIRNEYINIYYKGQNLLKIERKSSGKYCATPFKKSEGLITSFVNFADRIPLIKNEIDNISAAGKEIEFEQMLIRANNYEPQLNTEYFIIDRQIEADGVLNRFDLMAIFWASENRNRNRTAYPALIEVKYSLNPDIQQVKEQLEKYYKHLSSNNNMTEYVQVCDKLLKQKLKLGLIVGSPERLKALEQLQIMDSIKQMKFIIALVDYNPNGKKFNSARAELKDWAFTENIDIEIYHVGFGLWSKNAQKP